MMLRQDHAAVPTTNGSTMPPPAIACGNCGTEERRLLHNVRHRGIFRRLCTTCVLRLHPQSFCPTCFTVYHPSPPPTAANEAVTCFKCYSSSHSQCVGPNPPSPYVCPNCVSPNSPIFTLKNMRDSSFPDNDSNSSSNGNCRVIDYKAAKILLAAARIASVSMTKAASAARAEAERRAKEAAVTRKRAREALEHVMALAAREKMKKSEAPLVSSVQASRLINAGAPIGRAGNASNAVAAGGGVLAERSRVSSGERMDSSSGVLAALNAVDLREKEKLGAFKPQSLVSGQTANDGVAMDVENARGVKIASNSGVQDHAGASVSERLGKMDVTENQNVQGEKPSNGMVPVASKMDQMQVVGMVPVASKEDQMQVVEISRAGDQDNGKLQ